MIGHTVCINKEQKWDPMTTLADLMSLDELEDFCPMEPWSKALLEQLRLVYSNSHGKTLGFAMAIQELTERLCSSMKPPWSTENARIKDLAKDLLSCPYAGLVESLPEVRQVKSWPRMAYMGLKYREKNLAGTEKAEAFTKYKIEDVANHIDDQADKDLCISMVEAIPTDSIVGKARLCAQVPLSAAKEMMSKLPNELKNHVLRYLIDSKIDCDWRKFREQQLQIEERKRVATQLGGIAQRAITDKIALLNIAAQAETDKTQTIIKFNQITALSSRLNSALGEEHNLRRMVPDPDDDNMQEIFEAEIDRFEKFLDRVRAITYDNISQS